MECQVDENNQSASICCVACCLHRELPMGRWNKKLMQVLVECGKNLYRRSIKILRLKSNQYVGVEEVVSCFYIGDSKYCIRLEEALRGTVDPEVEDEREKFKCAIRACLMSCGSYILTVERNNWALWLGDRIMPVCCYSSFILDPQSGMQGKKDCTPMIKKYTPCLFRYLDLERMLDDLVELICGIGRKKRHYSLAKFSIESMQVLERSPASTVELQYLNHHCKEAYTAVAQLLRGKKFSQPAEDTGVDLDTLKTRGSGYFLNPVKVVARSQEKSCYCKSEGNEMKGQVFLQRPPLDCREEVTEAEAHSHYIRAGDLACLMLEGKIPLSCYKECMSNQDLPVVLVALKRLETKRASGWDRETMDDIVHQGSEMYMEFFRNSCHLQRPTLLGLSRCLDPAGRWGGWRARTAAWGRSPGLPALLAALLAAGGRGVLHHPGKLNMAVWNEQEYYYLLLPKNLLSEKSPPRLLCFHSMSLLTSALTDVLPSAADICVSRIEVGGKEVPEEPESEIEDEFKPVHGRVHQLSESQGLPSAVGLLAIATDHAKPAESWTGDDIDQMIDMGDEMFLTTKWDRPEHCPVSDVSLQMLPQTFSIKDMGFAEAEVIHHIIAGLLYCPSEKAIVPNLQRALQRFFKDNSHGMLTAHHKTYVLWKGADGRFYCLNHVWMDKEEETCVDFYLMRFVNEEMLSQYVESDLPLCTDDSFQISAVNINLLKINPATGIVDLKLEGEYIWQTESEVAVLRSWECPKLQPDCTLFHSVLFGCTSSLLAPYRMAGQHLSSIVEYSSELHKRFKVKYGKNDARLLDEMLEDDISFGMHAFSIMFGPKVAYIFNREPAIDYTQKILDNMTPSSYDSGRLEAILAHKFTWEKCQHLVLRVNNTLVLCLWRAWPGGPVALFQPESYFPRPVPAVPPKPEAPPKDKKKKGKEAKGKKGGGKKGKKSPDKEETKPEENKETAVIPPPVSTEEKEETAPATGKKGKKGGKKKKDEESGSEVTKNGNGEQGKETEQPGKKGQRKSKDGQDVAPQPTPPPAVTGVPQCQLEPVPTPVLGEIKGTVCVFLYPALNMLAKHIGTILPYGFTENRLVIYPMKVTTVSGALVATVDPICPPLEDTQELLNIGQHFTVLASGNWFLVGDTENERTKDRRELDYACAMLGVVADCIEPCNHWNKEVPDAALEYGGQLHSAKIPGECDKRKPFTILTSFFVSDFKVNLDITRDVIVGDIRAREDEHEEILSVSRGLNKFFGELDNTHGVLMARNYIVAVWTMDPDEHYKYRKHMKLYDIHHPPPPEEPKEEDAGGAGDGAEAGSAVNVEGEPPGEADPAVTTNKESIATLKTDASSKMRNASIKSENEVEINVEQYVESGPEQILSKDVLFSDEIQEAGVMVDVVKIAEIVNKPPPPPPPPKGKRGGKGDKKKKGKDGKKGKGGKKSDEVEDTKETAPSKQPSPIKVTQPQPVVEQVKQEDKKLLQPPSRTMSTKSVMSTVSSKVDYDEMKKESSVIIKEDEVKVEEIKPEAETVSTPVEEGKVEPKEEGVEETVAVVEGEPVEAVEPEEVVESKFEILSIHSSIRSIVDHLLTDVEEKILAEEKELVDPTVSEYIFSGNKCVVFLWDPQGLCSEKLRVGYGKPTVVGFSSTKDLADFFVTNACASGQGPNRYTLTAVQCTHRRKTPEERAASPRCPPRPGSTPEGCRRVEGAPTAYIHNGGGRTFLIGGDKQKRTKQQAIRVSVCWSLTAVVMRHLLDMSLWSSLTLDDIAAVSTELRIASENKMGCEFVQKKGVLHPSQVIKDFLLEKKHVHFEIEEMFSQNLDACEDVLDKLRLALENFFTGRDPLGILYTAAHGAAAVWKSSTSSKQFLAVCWPREHIIMYSNPENLAVGYLTMLKEMKQCTVEVKLYKVYVTTKSP